jgi:hypothetical protein
MMVKWATVSRVLATWERFELIIDYGTQTCHVRVLFSTAEGSGGGCGRREGEIRSRKANLHNDQSTIVLAVSEVMDYNYT